MEHAAFELLDESLLKELGKLVINFGFVEFLLDIHVGLKLFGIRDVTARAVLVAPLPARRKVGLLEEGVSKLPENNDETRALVADACRLIREALNPRNDLLHGTWGLGGFLPGGRPVCVTTKKTTTYRTAEDIAPTADKLAIASRLLLDALAVDQGMPKNVFPERLLLDTTGTQRAG